MNTLNQSMQSVCGCRQRGAALITGLVLLLVLTLIGVTAMRTTSLEDRMAYHTREANTAFQMAEFGLRGGEIWLDSIDVRPLAVAEPAAGQVFPLGSTLVGRDIIDIKHTEENGVWTRLGQEVTVDLDLDDDDQDDIVVADNPRFVVEEIGLVADSLDLGAPPSGIMYFRVTSSGVAAADTTQAIVQSTYSKRF